MEAIFLNENIRKILQKEINSWIGTPYQHFMKQKGKGVDCSLFLGALFCELGILNKLEYKYYPKHWFLKEKNEVILNYINRHFNEHLNSNILFKEENFRDKNFQFMVGDILCFSVSKQVKVDHVGVIFNSKYFAHALWNKAVRLSFLDSYWKKLLTIVYRGYWR